MRGFVVGALLVAVAVLGYLYWQETKNDVSIELEAPKITTPNTN
jgi:predicted negative regulator of RcsB-dependent stress response